MEERYQAIYSIGEAAKKLGVVVPFLRSLEKAGILLSARTVHGKRLYSECDLDYIRLMIGSSRLKDMSLEEIHCKLAGQRCWEVVGCDPSVREKCPNYRNLQEPCWLRSDYSLEEKSMRCHDCPVYRAVPDFID